MTAIKTIYSFLFFSFFSFISFSQTLELTLTANNFNDPVEMAHTNDNRLFVVKKSSVIKILNNDESVNTTPFIYISASFGSGGERGLLGLAFAPDYKNSGRFYVNYTDNSSTQTPNTVVAKYTVNSNPDIANTTETFLLTIPQPYNNHNAGKLAFGKDSFLYIASGDDGSGGGPGNRSQNTNTLLGKLLRLDVSGSTYTIPTTNPFVTTSGLPEIYAIGLRNPWKLSFDRDNGDLWVTDVGQSAYEEINKPIDSGTPGDNYGWRCYEGANNFNNESSCPPMSSIKLPVSKYNYGNDPNGFRCAITSGYVYRGSMFPGLVGKYLFADYCSGEIGVLVFSGNSWSILQMDHPSIIESWISFGEDNSGELYIVGGNAIYKINDINLSVNEEELSTNFKLFPNPSKGEVTIHFGTNISHIESISIKNNIGQEIKTFNNLVSENISI